MKRILDFLPFKGEFTKNAFTLTLGTSIAQAFPILLYPVLGRIFAPSDFGLLATLLSITSILAVVATGRYESSILIIRTKKDAANIVGFVLLLSSSALLISFIILQLASNQISVWFNDPGFRKWLFVCPISAFAIIIFNCYNEWCVRNKYFVSLAYNKITNSASITLSKLFFGLIKITCEGLVIGDLIGRIISALGCVFRVLKNDREAFLQISFKRMGYLSKRYIEFPKYTLPGQLLNSIAYSLPVFMIGAYFGSVEVGYFTMTMNVLSVPGSVISIALKDVFRQRANEEYVRTHSCVNLFLRLLKVLVFWGVIGSVLLFFALPELFSIVLGDQWRVSGVYSQILLPMMAIDFVATSLSGILVLTEKLKVILYWQIYYTCITVLSLLLGFILFQDIKSSLICLLIGRSSAYLLQILLSYKYSKGEIKNVRE